MGRRFSFEPLVEERVDLDSKLPEKQAELERLSQKLEEAEQAFLDSLVRLASERRIFCRKSPQLEACMNSFS